MKILTESEAKTLYVHLVSSTDPRDTFIQIMFETGARVSEVVTMTSEDLGGNVLTIKPLKNSKLRRVEISNNLKAKLDRLPPRWCKAIGETVRRDSLRRSLCRYFHSLTEDLLGRRYNLHTLRHTAFSRLYVATKDLLLVKNWAGHKSINSTMAYMHADQREEANQASNTLLKALAG